MYTYNKNYNNLLCCCCFNAVMSRNLGISPTGGDPEDAGKPERLYKVVYFN